MENLIEGYIQNVCEDLHLLYLKEANAKKIKQNWNIDLKVDKSSRRVDYVINKKGKIYFLKLIFIMVLDQNLNLLLWNILK